MQLSLQTDYSLRLLLLLASNPERRITINEVADRYAISAEHLRKVVHLLGKLQVIKTYRGKKGGFELAKTPETINLGELVAITENRQPLVDCYLQPCLLARKCRMKSVLSEAQDAFYAVLNNYHLADLYEDTDMQLLVLPELA